MTPEVVPGVYSLVAMVQPLESHIDGVPLRFQFVPLQPYLGAVSPAVTGAPHEWSSSPTEFCVAGLGSLLGLS